MLGRKAIQSKRGFTLAELVVVMAVMGIMVMMVVSFTMLCSAWSTWGTNRYKLTSSERMCSTFLRKFVSIYDCRDYYFETNTDNTVLTAVSVSNPSRRYSFYLTEGDQLEFNMPDAEDGYCDVEFVSDVRFAVRTNAKHQQLILMRIVYRLPDTSVGSDAQLSNYDMLVCTRATGAKP